MQVDTYSQRLSHQIVFVKSMDVQHCKNLAEHTFTGTSRFHGRFELTRECVHVDKTLSELSLPGLASLSYKLSLSYLHCVWCVY